MSRDHYPTGISTMRDKQAFRLKPHIVDELCNKMFTCPDWHHRSRNIRHPAAQSRLRELCSRLAPLAL